MHFFFQEWINHCTTTDDLATTRIDLFVCLSLTFHCEVCGAGVLPHLDAVRAGVGQRHLSDVELAVAAFAADLEALGRQNDGAALVPADTAAGVGHGAVQHHATLLHGGLVLQRLDDADRHLWRSVTQRHLTFGTECET